MTAKAPDLQATLRQIVAQASMIFERLEAPFLPPTGAAASPEGEALIQSRLNEWARALSVEGKREELDRFLEWEGLDLAAARRAVGPVRLREDAPLPAWAETLGEALTLVLAGGKRDEPGDAARFQDADEPLPFEDLLTPFVHLFRQRLEARVPAGGELLTTGAQVALERALLWRLMEAAAPTLYAEFQVSRATGLSPLASLLAQAPDALYQDFVQRMKAGGLVTFFQKYPVLARKLGTLTHFWTEAHVEFLQRLAADLPAIARTFRARISGVDGPPSSSPRSQGEDRPPSGSPRPQGEDGPLSGSPRPQGEDGPGRVKGLEPALSDFHRGGRSAMALTFASGLRLVYKPKEMGTEAAYNRLLAWLNEQGAPLEMKALQVLDRTSHGWVTFAEHEPCTDEAAVARYYRRAGALLCLVYALEGADCHEENLVASGEYPILIDNETLLHHRVRLEDLGDLQASARFRAYKQLDHSVLRTGLLPSWTVGKDQQMAFDISGLGGYADQAIPYRGARWAHVNTDRMKLSYELARLPAQANIPHLGDRPARVEEHAEEVLAGFEATYRFLLARRERLLAADGPLVAFRGQPVRFVFRATQVYGLILKQVSQPRYLRDGADYSLPLEMLARAQLLAEAKPSSWPILRAERRAMQQGDIPFLTARTDDGALLLDPGGGGQEERIAAYFTGPSFDLAVRRLRALDEDDLVHQMRLIQVALHSRGAREGGEAQREVFHLEPQQELALPRLLPLEPEDLVAEAAALAEGLALRAIRGADGSATWIAPLLLPEAERFQLGHLGLHLYDGLAGVALFLAALDSVAAANGYRELSLAALQTVRRELGEVASDPHTSRQLEIGGAAGLGSILYALVRIAGILDEPALLAEASAAVRLLTPDLIAADEILDIVGGAAGAILGLLAVYEATQDAVARARAVDCGRHLLARRQASAAGPRAWPTIGERLLTGFAHGAAGIAYALLRLYAATGQDDFLAAAEEAIAYEHSVFDESEGNWPDLRPFIEDAQGQKFSIAWCHGAPGIGLARLGGLPMLDTPAVRRDLEVALSTTQQALAYQHLDSDHVCCGNMGRVEVLFTAGQRLGRAELMDRARRQASQAVARAGGSEGYRFAAMLPRGVYSPGFFQGAAGIGYELLRLAYPDRFPSVLLWE